MLIRHYFDVVEIVTQPRIVQLPALVQQVAFGGDNKFITPLEVLLCFGNALYEFNGLFKQFFAILYDFFDRFGANGIIRNLQRGLNH